MCKMSNNCHFCLEKYLPMALINIIGELIFREIFCVTNYWSRVLMKYVFGRCWLFTHFLDDCTLQTTTSLNSPIHFFSTSWNRPNLEIWARQLEIPSWRMQSWDWHATGIAIWWPIGGMMALGIGSAAMDNSCLSNVFDGISCRRIFQIYI